MSHTRTPTTRMRPGDATQADATPAEEVMREHYDHLVRLAWLLTGDQDEARDAVGEAMAKALRRKRSTDGPDIALRRAVVREACSSVRRLRARRRRRRHGGAHRRRPADGTVGDAELVGQALTSLPAGQRTAVVLRHYERLPQAQAAAVMGCSHDSVERQRFRGAERLRAALDGHNPGA